MRESEAVELLADDPVAGIDVPALARAQGWSVTSSEEQNFTRFQLEKIPAASAC